MESAVLVGQAIAVAFAASFGLVTATLKVLSAHDGKTFGFEWKGGLRAFAEALLSGPVGKLPKLAISKVLDTRYLRTDPPLRLRPVKPLNRWLLDDDKGFAFIVGVVGSVPLAGYLVTHDYGHWWTFVGAGVSAFASFAWISTVHGACLQRWRDNRELTDSFFMSVIFSTFAMAIFAFVLLESLAAIVSKDLELAGEVAIGTACFLAAVSVGLPRLLGGEKARRYAVPTRLEKWGGRIMFGLALSQALTVSAFYLGRWFEPAMPVPRSSGMVAVNAVCDVLTIQVTLWLLTQTINRWRVVNGNRANSLVFEQDEVIQEELIRSSTSLRADCNGSLRQRMREKAEEVERKGVRYGLRNRRVRQPSMSIGMAILLDVIAAALLACVALWFGVMMTPGQSLSLLEVLRVLVGLSPDGTAWSFGPYFWVMHTTFFPTVMYLSVIAFFMVMRGALLPVGKYLSLVGEEDDPAAVLMTLSGWGTMAFGLVTACLEVVKRANGWG